MCANHRPEIFTFLNYVGMFENVIIGSKPYANLTFVCAGNEVGILMMGDPPMKWY
jgi:hypothetical protein